MRRLVVVDGGKQAKQDELEKREKGPLTSTSAKKKKKTFLTGASVPQVKVLIRELRPVDRFAAAAVASSEVSTLTHKRGDDAVEARADEALFLCRFLFCFIFSFFVRCFEFSGNRNRKQKHKKLNNLPGRVASSAKFVAVLGTTSSLSSNTTRPRGVAESPRPSWMSK